VPAEIDARRVERVLRNLLNNAVDHGEGLPVRVRVAADEHAVAIVVRDFGVGLREGEAELVFNRFWRADPSRNRRTGGTGLGLAISVEDARLHGGWLEAWGERGKGACFRLTLPRHQGQELTDSPLSLPPDNEPPVRELEEAEVSPLVVAEIEADAEVEEIAWQLAESVALDESTTPEEPAVSGEPSILGKPLSLGESIGFDKPVFLDDRAASDESADWHGGAEQTAVTWQSADPDDLPDVDPDMIGHDPELDGVPNTPPSFPVPSRAEESRLYPLSAKPDAVSPNSTAQRDSSTQPGAESDPDAPESTFANSKSAGEVR
jgi:two-component system sensor histidine kinase MtrB